MLGGGLAIFGVAGYFAIENITRSVAANVSAQDVATYLIEKEPEFVRMVQGGVGLVAKDSVIAFDADECPKGWAAYASAQGKFIIGIGGVAGKKFQESGGDLEHSHDLAWQEAYQVQPVTGAPSTVGVGLHGRASAISKEVLPPFIALNFCKKMN